MFSLRIYLFCIVLICVVNEIVADQYKIVETLDGKVRGIQKLTLLNNVTFHSFKGIPYAKQPIGDLRFKAPEPAESWSPIIRDAFEHSAICIQPRIYTEPFTKSENCLTLNIYVPSVFSHYHHYYYNLDNVKPGEKLSVLFFVHGGGFMDGSGDEYFYGPDFIVEKGIILVTINYRLGPLGFLSFDTPEYSGNMGLKDQRLALKWISLNIDRFGGDYKRITICGQSAGGASIHFHMLSTESRKYFNNAISMSGVVDNYWALSESNNHLEIAHKIANDFDGPKNSTDELIAFLKTIPADEFISYSHLITSTRLIDIPFKPIIERSDAIEPFMIESLEIMYDTTTFDFDVLFTMVSKELLGYLFLFPPLKNLLADFNFPLPFRGLDISPNSEEHHQLMSIIQKFYFGDGATENQTVNYVDLLSDTNFGYAIDKIVKLHASKSRGKTYYSCSELVNVSAASHEDELFYLFRRGQAQPILSEIINNSLDKESKVCLQTIDYITKIISNFVKYGEPSYQNDLIRSFQPVQNGSVHFLDINNDGLKIGLRPNEKAFDFWAYIEQQARQISTNMKKN
ncbi:esterase B1-like [Sitodiplosis mosellana]|uniref:esterase B1-like n=1 Tax=Sitodiplosis mosellana TaxID=263140 RepID=UPI0024439E47|nr:esterase B1-like [Sitodiplosis mosellana]